MKRMRRLAQLVLRVQDSPTRVARAFGVGVFIAFFPVWGVHTVMALLVSWALGLNRVATLAGTFTNNPWTVAPMYTAGTLVGCGILRVSPAAVTAVDWGLSGEAFYASLLAGFRPLLWPFVVGNLILGVAAGVVSFLILRGILRSRAGGGVRS